MSSSIVGYGAEAGSTTNASGTGMGGRPGGVLQGVSQIDSTTINSVTYPIFHIFGGAGETVVNGYQLLEGSAEGGNSLFSGGGVGGNTSGPMPPVGGYGSGGGSSGFNNATATAGANGGNGAVLIIEIG